MTQTASNNGNYSRLDRSEAILERTVENNTELRSALSQRTQQADTFIDRVDIVTRRMDNFVERVGRYEEQTDRNISELLRMQVTTNEAIRQLIQGQIRLKETQVQMQQTVAQIEEAQTSLAAAQERQERILNYLYPSQRII